MTLFESNSTNTLRIAAIFLLEFSSQKPTNQKEFFNKIFKKVFLKKVSISYFSLLRIYFTAACGVI